MKKRLNHSRYIDVYAKDMGDRAYDNAKQTPTAKQVKFYKKLYAMCKEHGIDATTGRYTLSRVDYARAIDMLLERLKDAGVDVSGNGKDATYALTIGEDRRKRDYAYQHIIIKDGEKDEMAQS